MANVKPLNGFLTAFILIAATAIMVLLAWYLRYDLKFIFVMVCMLGFMIAVGTRVTGRPAGILINERNLVSLARFQIVLWTLIILSAYLIAAFGRIKGGVPNPLAIGLDERLWALLGISTTSLIGSPLIQSTKKTQNPKPEAIVKASAALTAKGEAEPADEIKKNAQGVLYANANIQDAAFSDMFEGEEVSNAAYVDVAKVQMFFFTIIAALSYGMELLKWTSSNDANVLANFPVVSSGLVAILGISHAGFLVNKSTTHTPTE